MIMKILKLIFNFLTICILFSCTKEGPTGKKSLIDMAIENKGENCSSGGYKIMSGIDLNDNDILDDNEIQTTKYICNGTNGINGNNSLINIVAEPAGSICSSGGFKIVSGIDLNNNGILDLPECQNTQYVCNGDDGDYDKQIRFMMYSNMNNKSTSDTTIFGPPFATTGIYQFNLQNYLNVDSVILVVYNVRTSMDCCSGIDITGNVKIELFDLTNNRPINNSEIITDDIETGTYLKSANLKNEFPNEYINLGVRLITDGSYFVGTGYVFLFLYRN